MTTLRAGAATDVGRVRSINQDSYLEDPGSDLFGVADGIGGHQGGEVASAMAVELIREGAQERNLQAFVQAVRDANRTIFEKAGSDRSLHGMGTTFVGLRVVDGPEGDEIGWVNVGDSRLYLLRDDEIVQISADHSLVEELVREGQISEEEARVHPQRNIVTRSLGIDLDVRADASSVLPYNGDRYLLCSDGLSNEVSDESMADVLRRISDPGEAATELVRMANDAGGRDNITVVIVDVLDDGGRSERASAALAAMAQTARSTPPPDGEIDREADTDALPVVTAQPEGAAPAGATETTGSGAPQIVGGPADDDEIFTGRASSLPAATDDYGAETDDPFDALDGARTRRITWRVVAFFGALLLIAAAVVGFTGWDARNSYYVAFDDGEEVTIYRGRPGGVLFFQPEALRTTGLMAEDVDARYREDVRAGKVVDSENEAERFVESLRTASRPVPTTSTTTPSTTSTSEPAETTTTTTAPAETTTTAAPGP